MTERHAEAGGHAAVVPALVRLLANSAGLRICGLFLGFVMGVLLARGLGPAGYGVYGTAMALISILMLPTEFGLPQLVTREVAAMDASPEHNVTRLIVRWARNRVVAASLLIMVVVATALLTGLADTSAQLRTTILIGLLWIPVVALGNIYGAALRGMHRLVLGQLGEILIRPALMSLSLFLLAAFAAGMLDAPLAMALNVAAAFVAALVALWLLKRELHARQMARTGELPPGVRFKQALPIAMTEGLRVLSGQAGILMLAYLASDYETGQYRVALQIYAFASLQSTLVNIACAPMVASLFSQGRMAELRRFNIWISAFMTACAGVALLLFLLFGRPAVLMLFGKEYEGAIAVLLVFLTGELVCSLFGHPVMTLNMVRQSRIVMLWSAVSLAVTAALIACLAPSRGAVGAAMGTSAGLIVWSCGCALHARLKLGMATSLTTAWRPRRA